MSTTLSVECLEPRLLFAAGDYDESFSFDGRVSADILHRNNTATDVAVQLDGKILVAGITETAASKDLAMIRFNADGTLDKTFGTGGDDGDARVTRDFGGFDEIVTCMALQRDGKILIGGKTRVMITTQGFVARFNRDGSVDSNFGSNGVAFLPFGTQGAIVNDIALQDDGKIVAVGTVPSPLGGNNIGVARLTKFGSFDFDFSGNGFGIHDGGATYDQGNAVVVQEDGKILIAGTGDDPKLEGSDGLLIRLLPDGSLDDDFDVDGKAIEGAFDDDGFSDVEVLPNGRIYTVGSSAEYAYIVEFGPDGTFRRGTGQRYLTKSLDEYQQVVRQADNKLVAVGEAADGGYSYSFVRRYEEGTRFDDTFASKGTKALGFSQGGGVALQPDGKIVLVGTSDGSTTGSDFSVVRLNAFDDDAGSISGRIFKDRDADGTRDSNDAGHAGVRVFADLDKDGKFDRIDEPSMLTDGNGKYTIPGLPPGSYRVREIIPKGFRRTRPAKAYYNTTLDPAENVDGKDFGNTQKVLISGRVFRDDDADAQLDDGEQGMKNWTVYIDLDRDGKLGDNEPTDVTDETGRWSFDDLDAGVFVVRIVKRSGFDHTTPTRLRISLDKGQASTDNLFGQVRQ